MRIVCHIKKDPLSNANGVAAIIMIGSMMSLGIVSGFIENTYGIDVLPRGIVGVVATVFSIWFVIPVVTYLLVLRHQLANRLRRFFDAPFCMYCEYEIPEIIVTPERAKTLESTVRCTECGKICQRIVVRCHAGAA